MFRVVLSQVIFALLLGVLCLTASFGCGGPYTSHPSPSIFEDIIIPYVMNTKQGKTVYVTTGAAREDIRLISNKSDEYKLNIKEVEYYDFDIHQNRKVMTCIRKYQREISDSSSPTFRLEYQLLVIDLASKKKRILYSIAKKSNGGGNLGIGLASPRWTDNGDIIRLLVKNSANETFRLLSVNSVHGDIVESTALPFGDNEPFYEPPETVVYFRENKNTERIYVNLGDSLWILNLDAMKFHKAWSGRHLAAEGNRIKNIPKNISKDIVTALFGSFDFPVVRPHHHPRSNDYFFESWGYYDHWEGASARGRFFGRHYRRFIGVYDASRQQPYYLKVLEAQWHPFPLEW